MEGKINLCGDKYGMSFTLNEILPSAYVERSALRNITDIETYNLAPTWKNYQELVSGEGKLNLSSDADSYDIMTLLYIKEQGYPQGGMTHEYPNEFSFDENFESIEEELAGKTIYDSMDEVQDRAKELAVAMLKAHFPDIRKEQPIQEVKHVASVGNIIRDRGIKM